LDHSYLASVHDAQLNLHLTPWIFFRKGQLSQLHVYKAVLYNQHEMQPYPWVISTAYVREFETVPKEIHQNPSDAAFLALEQPALDSARNSELSETPQLKLHTSERYPMSTMVSTSFFLELDGDPTSSLGGE
jgi:hypothetical protein